MTADPADNADWFETALAHYPNAHRPYDQGRTQLALPGVPAPRPRPDSSGSRRRFLPPSPAQFRLIWPAAALMTQHLRHQCAPRAPRS
jgi:hypothetical protein